MIELKQQHVNEDETVLSSSRSLITIFIKIPNSTKVSDILNQKFRLHTRYKNIFYAIKFYEIHSEKYCNEKPYDILKQWQDPQK